MDWKEIIISILIGGVSGWLAAKIMGLKGGLIRNIIVGIIGGIVGGFVFGLLNISIPGTLGTIIASVAGACLLTFVVRLLFK